MCRPNRSMPGPFEKMQRLIEQQQSQLDAQAKAIEDMKKQLQALSKAGQPSTATAEKLPSLQNIVKPGSDKVEVQLYGQVNRGVMYADDGNDSDFYHVDNDTSSTRLGINAKTRTGGDLEVGARFEVQYESNSSASVSQTSNSTGPDNFTQRHLDLFIESKRFGKLSIGQGNTASNETSEVDLSGTALVGYSDISTVGGGILFFDKTANSLSDTDIGDVFNNMDGLSRRDRLRYDTPEFFGFVLSGSAIENNAEDIALWYNRKFSGFKLAGAAAYANPGNTSLDNQLDGSVSILLDGGFNATFAAGNQYMRASGQDDATFYYAKIGFVRKYFDIGPTALSVDYGRYNDVDRNDDEADAIGFQFVQNLTDWRTELYMGYRHASLDRTGNDFEDINVVLGGGRIKF
ncbi:MAG: porin [Desulfobacterales bacterium]|nr:porin [Desulfobacterales bacterium]